MENKINFAAGRKAALELGARIKEARVASEQEAREQGMKILLAQGYNRQEAALKLRAERISALEARGFGARRIRLSSIRA